MKIFHHNDADGRCAAAIAMRGAWLNGDVKNVDDIAFIEMDYAKPVPFELVKDDELVVIVDFSFKPEDMVRLQAITANIVWIDHHATAKDYPYQHLQGLRDFTDKGLCGCELTWKYYFAHMPIPWAVASIGDYDSWRMQLKPSCLEFYEGLKLYDQAPTGELWNRLLDEDYMSANKQVNTIMDEGNAVIKYRDMYCRELVQAFGYECTLAGTPLKGFALNAYRFGSQAYESLKKGVYDVLIAYISDGHKTTVSLYSENPDVHCGELAKAYGGGGHKGAAGFHCPSNQPLPFTRKD